MATQNGQPISRLTIGAMRFDDAAADVALTPALCAEITILRQTPASATDKQAET